MILIKLWQSEEGELEGPWLDQVRLLGKEDGQLRSEGGKVWKGREPAWG